MRNMHFSLLFLFIFSGLTSFAQDAKHQVGVKPYLRRDSYPKFIYNFRDRPNADQIGLGGTSRGIDLRYKYAILNNLNIVAGVGVQKWRFNKITRSNAVYGKSLNRPIIYPLAGNQDLVHTDNYWYNNLTYSIGLEKLFPLANDFYVLTAAEYYHFQTYSQFYDLYNSKDVHQTKENKAFGSTAQASFGIMKRINKITISPQVSFPVFTTWTSDAVFAEVEEKRSKNFEAFVFGFQLNYILK